MLDQLKDKFLHLKYQLSDQFSSKKLIALIVLLLVASLGLIPTLYLVRQEQKLKAKASAGSVSLYIRSSAATVAPNNTVTVDFGINAGSNPPINPPIVTGVDVRLSYSDNLVLTSFTNGDNVGSGKALAEVVVKNPAGSTNPGNNIRLVAVNKTNNTQSLPYVALGQLVFTAQASTNHDAWVKFEDSGNQIVAVGNSSALVISNEGEDSTQANITITNPIVESLKPSLTSPAVGATFTYGSPINFTWLFMERPTGTIVQNGLRVVKAETGSQASLACSSNTVIDRWQHIERTPAITLCSSASQKGDEEIRASTTNTNPNPNFTTTLPFNLTPGTYYVAAFNKDDNGYHCSLNCTGTVASGNDPLSGFTTTQSFTVVCPTGTSWDGSGCNVLPTASPTTAPRVPGDATGDRCVNYADYNCWSSGAGSADFDNDGRVDSTDYTIWLDAFNSRQYRCASGQARTQCVN